MHLFFLFIVCCRFAYQHGKYFTGNYIAGVYTQVYEDAASYQQFQNCIRWERIGTSVKTMMFFSRFNAQRIVNSIDFFLPDFSCKKLFPSIPAFSVCFCTNIVIEFQTIASVGINLCRINIGKINWHKQRA